MSRRAGAAQRDASVSRPLRICLDFRRKTAVADEGMKYNRYRPDEESANA
jgi:hypothetical protein